MGRRLEDPSAAAITSASSEPDHLAAGDAAATRRILAMQDGPTILVGHSYGGAVVTEAGTHPTVAALVYITAFAPAKEGSVATLIKDPPPGAPVPPILAAAGRLSIPRPGEVPCLVCG
jgi:pimeloyl-ACP methyl ester carboxylesterase